MSCENRSGQSLVLSYLALRQSIGVIGLALPVVLLLGSFLLDGPQIQSSVSAYYYTSMGNVFVGALSAVGIFLMTYRGYDHQDSTASNIGCASAIGVAMFPTLPPEAVDSLDGFLAGLHYVSTIVLFLTFAYFAYYRFTRSNCADDMGEGKKMRNRIYRSSGKVIVICMALVALLALLPDIPALSSLQPVFWLEAVAIMAFGFAWLIKGETFFRDA